MQINAPLVAISIGLFLVLLTHDSLRHHHNLANQSIVRFQKAMTQSKSRLAATAHALAKEPSFAINIQRKRTHSLHNFLNGFLSDGEIDNIVIRTDAGKTVAFAKTTTFSPPPPMDLAKRKASFFYWHTADATPILGLAMPIGNTRVWVINQVHIGELWWQRNRTLESMRSILDLEIGRALPEYYLLVPDSPHEMTSYGNLISHDWLTNHRGFIAAYLKAHNDIVITLVTLISLLFLWILFRSHRLLASLKIEHEETLTRLAQIMKPQTPQPKPKNLSLEDFIHQSLEEAQRNLSQKEKIIEDQLRRIQRLELEGKEAILLKTENSYLNLQIYHSTRIRKHLMENLYNLKSKIEDSSDILKQGILNSNNQIFQIVSGWHKSLSQISPRKFFRTLSEIKKNQGSELDYQISGIIEQTSQMSQYAVNLGLQINTIARIVDSSQTLAATSLIERNFEYPVAKVITKTVKDLSKLAPRTQYQLICAPDCSLLKSTIASATIQLLIQSSIEILLSLSQDDQTHITIRLYHKPPEILIIVARKGGILKGSKHQSIIRQLEKLEALLNPARSSIVFIPYFKDEKSITISIPGEMPKTHANSTQNHLQNRY